MNLTGMTINECYKIIEKVGENSVCDVYKAEGVFSPLEFALKIFKKPNEEYKIEDIIRFKKDMMSIYRIYHPNITKVFEIDDMEDHTFVTMEFTYGMTLHEYISAGNKLSFDNILLIIHDVADGLEVAHRNGSLHRNLNLQNIILSLDKNEIKSAKITNFGFGELFLSYADKETMNDLLFYMPPEICSTFNKKYDSRSDLFSLGIIFYYLLTGRYPFTGKSVEDYFRNVTSVRPEPPSKISGHTVPAVLDKIILKLLSINKNERYQSALGVLTDIQRIKRNELFFELGIEDESFTTVFQTDLIDRQEEMALLTGLYEKAKGKSGNGLLITGNYGSGKSRLTEELGRHVIRNSGIFIKAACINSALPYNVFRMIISALFYHLTTLDDETRENIVKKIDEIDASLDRVLMWFVNAYNLEIREYTGKDSIIIKAPDDLQGKLSDFLCRISFAGMPLVIAVNNIQHADPDSLELIGVILKKIHDYPLQLLLTYSDRAAADDGHLQTIVSGEINRLGMKPITPEDVKSLVHDILKDRDNNITKSISGYVNKISMGEPYYVLETLRQLINDGVVYPDIDRWDIDLKKFIQKSGENNHDIILKKLQLLRGNELNILTIACLIDAEFDTDLIFKLIKIDKDEVISIVDDLIDEDFLKIYSNYPGTSIYADSITRDVLTGKLDRNKMNEIDGGIAEVFEESIGDFPYNVFTAAHHYLKAGNTDKAVYYCMQSGLKAKSDGARNAAAKFFHHALDLLEKSSRTGSAEYEEIKKHLSGLD